MIIMCNCDTTLNVLAECPLHQSSNFARGEASLFLGKDSMLELPSMYNKLSLCTCSCQVRHPTEAYLLHFALHDLIALFLRKGCCWYLRRKRCCLLVLLRQPGLLRHGSHTEQPASSENATTRSAHATKRVQIACGQTLEPSA